MDAASRMKDMLLTSSGWHRKLRNRDTRAARRLHRSCIGCWTPHYDQVARGMHAAARGSSWARDAGRPCCSNNGDCVLGLCVCRGGAFGIDCAHSGKLADSPPPRRRRAFGIYVYDVPAEFGSAGFASPRHGPQGSLYWAERAFVDLLVRDDAVRTLDPHAADLFFVPLWAVELASNTGCAKAHVDVVIAHLRGRYPFWNRTDGADHVILLAGDKGACGLGPTNAIVLSHWGLLGPWSTMDPHNGAKYWAAIGRDTNRLAASFSKGEACHSPHKDIVIPPFHMIYGTMALPTPPSRRAARYALVHAGGIWSWKNVGPRHNQLYSQGVRQALWARFGSDPGGSNGSVSGVPRPILLTPRAVTDDVWLDSQLCLAPSGEGFGQRVSKFALLGCVPLIAQPYVSQPFDELLRYDRFSRRIHAIEEVSSSSRLADMLRALDSADDEIAAMREELASVRGAFVWDVSEGGWAYNLTIRALCMRAIELRGQLHSGATSCDAAAARTGAPFLDRSSQPPTWWPRPLVTAVERLKADRRSSLGSSRVRSVS